MRKSFSLFLVFSLISIGLSAHKFYVSITDITYNVNSKTFEIIIKVFLDDFEQSLTQQNDLKLNLGTDQEYPKTDSLIEVYVSQHFALTGHSKPIKYRFLGKETDQDYVWIYLESEKTKMSDLQQIKNSLLITEFEAQINHVNLNYFSSTKSYGLSKASPTIQITP